MQQQVFKEIEYDQVGQQNRQLGELRHTRDRLKLNLSTSNNVAGTSVCPSVKQNNSDIIGDEKQLFSVEKR